MVLRHLLLQILWVTVASSLNLTKPACQRKCGEVGIPYPFGTGNRHCFRDEGFEIICNNSFNPPKPFISQAGLELEELDIDSATALVKSRIAWECHDKMGETDQGRVSFNLDKTPFGISSTNQFMAIGCNTLANFTGSDFFGLNHTTGCTSYCDDKASVNSASCNDNGCCEIPISYELNKFWISVQGSSNISPCSYSLVVDKEKMDINTSLLFNTSAFDPTSRVPVLLDWGIENKTCESAQRNRTSYACSKNSYCINSTAGYFCRCKLGYEGNPYLSNGCKRLTAGQPLESDPPPTPGCAQKCGEVDIPYPFGFGKEGCYRDQFEIYCNNSFHPPKPFIDDDEVLEISLDQYQVSIRRMIDWDWQDNESREQGISLDFEDTPYTISNTHNKFIAVGCNDRAIIRCSETLGLGPTDAAYPHDCISLCDNNENKGVSSMFGSSSQQRPIPEGLKALSVNVSKQSDNISDRSYRPCICTFPVKADYQKTSLLLPRGNFTRTISLPLILDWAIGNETCEKAQKDNRTYACGPNTGCWESNKGPGYLCSCKKGYAGNPFSTEGCHDKTCQFPVVKVALGIGLSLLFLFFGFSWLHLWVRKRKLIKLKEKFFKQNGGLLLQQQISSHEGVSETTCIFTREELKKATNNFHETRIIGKGGFGIVYKGMLPDNRIVAIKMSKMVDKNQVEQFINEVMILSNINHRNVVKLLGCCLETQVPLLVYEFVSNGTLFHHLHNQECLSPISWQTRLRIASDTAGALSYLHFATSIPIFHRDVKSANILLDDNYMAKVSDFGASRPVQFDQTHVTTLVQGTFGYLDPEYFHTGQLTEKSDVYSFGVVLAELLTGEKPVSFSRLEEDKNLATYFILSMNEKRLFEIIEDRILKEEMKEQIVAVAELAQRCLKLKAEERPMMKDVATELECLKRLHVDKKSPPIEIKHERIEEEQSKNYGGDVTRRYSLEGEILHSFDVPRS